MKTFSLSMFVRRLGTAASLCFVTLGSTAQAVTLDTSLNETVMMLPVVGQDGTALNLETTIFKPPGLGPFPLLVMNHGKERGSPAAQKRDRFLAMSREFVKRGYAVVVPMRKGFAQSGGSYRDYGCNMKDNGQTQADDVQAALTAVLQQGWADPARIIVAGQSYGGLATMAFGTRHFPGVRGLLNFAGGLRIDGGSCDWRGALVAALADYAGKTSVPSLWFYGANDSYFDLPLASQMSQAYQQRGGQAELIAFGHFKSDAHGLAGSRDGVAIWWPQTERFLQSLGMPTAEVVALPKPPSPPATNFAAIDDVNAVPYLSEGGRQGYRAFLGKSAPRAFALSASGEWSWAEEGDDPADRVLSACQKPGKPPCKLYAIDQDVVWNDAVAPALSTQASGN